jgi:hypothetical protein
MSLHNRWEQFADAFHALQDRINTRIAKSLLTKMPKTKAALVLLENKEGCMQETFNCHNIGINTT